MKNTIAISLFFLLFTALQAQEKELTSDTTDQIIYTCPPCGCDKDGEHLSHGGQCPSCDMALRPDYPGLKRVANPQKRPTVGMLLYNGADIMDVTGPWSVFEHARFNIITAAKTKETVSLGMSMELKPDFTLENMPEVDILVIPGGGPAEMNQDMEIVEWIKKRYENTETLFSVCSGAFFLGLAGLLDENEATTFSSLIPSLSRQFPKSKVLNNVKYTDNGKIVTSAGLSSGVDAAFHVVSKYYGQGRAQDIANHMEYAWNIKTEYARTQLADNYLQSIRSLVGLFAKKYTYSHGDNQKWEYRFLLTQQLSHTKIINLVKGQLDNMENWKTSTANQNSITGIITHPMLGKGKVQIKVQDSPQGKVAILTSKKLSK